MITEEFFNADFLGACVEEIPPETYKRIGTFAIARELLEKDATLDATLILARYLETGQITE